VFAIERSSTVAPYEQLRRQIIGRIDDGSLPVGSRLPTIRNLAEELGVATNTVARAYRELAELGVIETRGRDGSFVAPGGDARRERALAHAQAFASTVRELGLSREQAMAIVAAALDAP
jgi:DNA-binding transcriptional regulator YhcF (GntR family)